MTVARRARAMVPWAGLVVVAALVWGWFEAGWLRTRIRELAVPELPPELEGLRIAHLSDLHLGPRGRGNLACRNAGSWVQRRRPDLVCITGDLVSHPRGEPALRALIAMLDRPYVVLGNHDVAITRDPFSAWVEPDLSDAVLLEDTAVDLELRGRRVQIVGVDPRSYARRRSSPERLADPGADLRILLCHYPRIAARLPYGVFHLILSGHLHGGQIVLPYPGGQVTLAHPRAAEVSGAYNYPGAVLHVSPGLGTAFVPFRVFARPEVTELVLRRRVGESPVPP